MVYMCSAHAHYYVNTSFKLVKMPKSYFDKLRWRAVWLAEARVYSVQEIASVLMLFMCEKTASALQFVSIPLCCTQTATLMFLTKHCNIDPSSNLPS